MNIELKVESLKCPICHSTKVKGFKVRDRYGWWHRCISNRNHGVLVMPSGEFLAWPETIYFTSDGKISTPHGILHVERQTRK